MYSRGGHRLGLGRRLTQHRPDGMTGPPPGTLDKHKDHGCLVQFHLFRNHTLLFPFNSGTFVVEALNKAVFILSKGSELATTESC